MIIGCEYDFVTPFYQQEELHKSIKNSELLFIKESGHGIMYEKPVIFTSTLLGFVNNCKINYNV
ncbi:MAG: alpha/beta hydrolase [Tissierellia bacterium]|nr:alpha/beta hydrolase [Tissierellia bacterium]